MDMAGVVVAVLVILHLKIFTVEASLGDRTLVFNNCLEPCVSKNCTTANDVEEFARRQPFAERVLRWSCPDECSYQCMWQTVDVFITNGLDVPQFYGKWPFVRFFGIQEPASMVFSLLNGLAHAMGIWIFMSKVHNSNPMYGLSVAFGMVAINTWIWSTVFHTRDFALTEKLDYFCATGGVLFSLYFCIHRMSMGLGKYPDRQNGKSIRGLASAALSVFFIVHVSYLSLVKFDYGYNMLATTVAGVCNGITWIYYHWATRKHFAHQWKATFAVCYASALLLLELQDFPPVWWVLDAHSIWHAGTIPFPIFWYSFLIDETRIFALDEKYD